MSDQKGRTRSGKPIRNYRKRADFILEGRPNGVNVPSEDKDDLEKSLKVFKRQMRESGIFETLREKKYYEKPSARKYRAKAEAVRYAKNQLKKERAEEKAYGCWTAIIKDQAV
jgi:small subunit ribosomal protein S21